MKIHTAAAGMLCLTALATSACVMPSTYDKAVADLTATRAEVASTRTEMQALTEQISELEQLKADLSGIPGTRREGYRVGSPSLPAQAFDASQLQQTMGRWFRRA